MKQAFFIFVGEDHKKAWIKRLFIENKVNFLGIQETMTGKKVLWDNLKRLIANHNNLSLIFGDLNEVRVESECMGTIFDPRGAYIFNQFIYSPDLLDLLVGGKRFTRMNNLGSKHSKIDRFLVTNHVIQIWLDSYVYALPREFSDHTPIILKNFAPDFGPTPFKLYNSWLEHSEFPDLAKASWALPTSRPPVVGFKNKLKRLKLEIKKWRIKIQHAENTTSCELRMKIDNLDNKAERSSLSPFEVDLRTS
ncbi:cytochrome P450 [Tanacetum coccineum]